MDSKSIPLKVPEGKGEKLYIRKRPTAKKKTLLRPVLIMNSICCLQSNGTPVGNQSGT